MKRKATTAQFDQNKRNRVAQELEPAEFDHNSFPLNDLPDMVLAIIVKLVVSLFLITLMIWPVFLGSLMCLPFEE